MLPLVGEGAEKSEVGGGCIGSAPLEVNAEESGGGAGYVEAEGLEGGADAFGVAAGQVIAAGAMLRRAEQTGSGEEGAGGSFSSLLHFREHPVEPLPFPADDAVGCLRGERDSFRRSYHGGQQ